MSQIPVRKALPDLSEIGPRLEDLRQLGRISARKLSTLIGASPNTIRNIETQLCQAPRGDVLVALAKVLGTTVEYLVTGQEPAPTRQDVEQALAEAGYKPEVREEIL